jgi:hypothetical protein
MSRIVENEFNYRWEGAVQIRTRPFTSIAFGFAVSFLGK